MPDLPDYERLIEEVANELRACGQPSLFTYAEADERGFDFNELVDAAEALNAFRDMTYASI